MRLLALVLVVLGVLGLAGGAVMGCQAIFAWNGRHVVAVSPVELGTPMTMRFDAVHGRRYTAGVQIVIDRDAPVKFPVVAHMRNERGETIAELTAWIDTDEPPTVLHGRGIEPRNGAPPPELVAERLVGPARASGAQPMTFEVSLGPDTVGQVKVIESRVVLYDDRLPLSVASSFWLAGLGAASFIAGFMVMFRGAFRRSRRRRARPRTTAAAP